MNLRYFFILLITANIRCSTQLNDAQALEYCASHNNVFVLNLFPLFQAKMKDIERIITNFGAIVYHKNVFLNKNGAVNFIRLCYEHEGWVGNSRNDFQGARKNAAKRFSKNHNTLKIYLVECQNLETIIACKRKIRSLFGGDIYAVHVNDTHEQGLILARAILNDANLNFLNNTKPTSFKTNLMRYRLSKLEGFTQLYHLNFDQLRCLLL